MDHSLEAFIAAHRKCGTLRVEAGVRAGSRAIDCGMAPVGPIVDDPVGTRGHAIGPTTIHWSFSQPFRAQWPPVRELRESRELVRATFTTVGADAVPVASRYATTEAHSAASCARARRGLRTRTGPSIARVCELDPLTELLK